MENEDIELDVEGIDVDSPSALSLGINPNELPSSVSSQLAPDLPQHPWLSFDQQFIAVDAMLDDDMDEESRATIHKMIKEEHSYIHTKKFKRKPRKLLSYKARWTEEEKTIFKKGIAKFGQNWKEIAGMIKTRSYNQVKSFARYYLKVQDQSFTVTEGHLSDSPSEMLNIDSNERPSKETSKGQGLLDHSESIQCDEEREVCQSDQQSSKIEEVEEEEDENIDIDVEETSEDEQRECSLQSRVLFGDILSVPSDIENSDTLMDKTSTSRGRSGDGNSNMEQTVDNGSCKSDHLRLVHPGHTPSKTLVRTAEADIDVACEEPAIKKISTKKMTGKSTLGDEGSELDASQTACSKRERNHKKMRKITKGSRKRRKESSEEEFSSNESKNGSFCNSIETTPVHSLPGNGRSWRTHDICSERNLEGTKEKRRKGRRNVVKEEITIQSEKENNSSLSSGYSATAVIVEDDDVDSSNLKSLRVINEELRESCIGIQGNLIVNMVEAERDVPSTAKTKNIRDDAEVSKDYAKHESQCVGIGEQHNVTEPFTSKVSEDPSSSDLLLVSASVDADLNTDGPDKICESRTHLLQTNKTSGDDTQNAVSDSGTYKSNHLASENEDEKETDDGSESPSQPCREFEKDDDNDGETDEETIELPKEEVTLDPTQVTYGEKQAHPSYFDYNSSTKTPERYLAIRNHIVKCWLKTKPSYLNKTTARNGLRKGGDVNNVGRIHSYLESIGAINFGAYNLNHRAKRKKKIVDQNRTQVPMRPKRNIPKLPREGNINTKSSSITKDKNNRLKPKQPKTPAYDPFKLIDCQKFSSDSPAPFRVEMKGDAIVTMDLHSHLSTTEVIGLLGGQYDSDLCVLDVRLARPCRSLSTGMQCEMDPVSQTEACEDIQLAGCRVVGWYHSHPTFSPNPSIRDIETQGHFQEWFSQDSKTPFIGVIVSPYHQRQLVSSIINCLTVSHDWSPELQCWRPYSFDLSVYHDNDVTKSHQNLLSVASQLIAEFSQYKYRVEMQWVCPGQSGITYLQKMLESVSKNLSGDEKMKTQTISKLKDMVYQLYASQASSIIQDSTDVLSLSFDSTV